MNSISFHKNRKIILLVLALVAIFSSIVISVAYFTDRVNHTTTVQTASFDAKGYELARTTPEGYLTSGETAEVLLKESNNKSEDISSQVTLTAGWDSPVLDTYPWGNSDAGNIKISLDGEEVFYTENKENNTISFVLPKNTLSSGAANVESSLFFQIPSDLAATGTLKLSFDQIKLRSGEWTYECDGDSISVLDFAMDLAWNISKDQTTALGNPNRDLIALLATGTAADDYSLEIIKNGSDTNTNYGQMMNWTDKGQTPWAEYCITNLTISEGITTIGCYAFAGEIAITKLSLPGTVHTIGISAFQGSGLSGELVFPTTVAIIESLAFGDLPDVDSIIFEHGSDDSLILPDNTSEGEETSGAFHVPDFVKTTFEFNGNSAAENYNWVADNRMKVGISEILLSYDSLQKGGTAKPTLVLSPEYYDDYQSIQYEITSGADYATIDADTGVLTGTAIGTVTVQVTIVDANGDTVQAIYDVDIQAVPVASATLSYEDVAIGSTVNPTLTIEPANADIVSKTYEITSGSSYATINTSTGALTATGNGVVVVKVTIIDETGKEAIASCTVTCGTPAAGTRYVWEKWSRDRKTSYSYINSNNWTSSEGSLNDLLDYDNITSSSGTNGTLYYAVYSSYARNDTNSKFIVTNIKRSGSLSDGDSLSLSADEVVVFDWQFGTFDGTTRNIYVVTGDVTLDVSYGSLVKYKWYYTINESTNNYFKSHRYLPTTVYVQGSTSYGYVSNAGSSKYPANNYSGSYWYVYQGADVIDADAVTYSASSVTAGEDISVNVTPSTKNVYGGTISYQYEYSTDGGSTWITAGTTTETSYTITAPEDADSFMARVRASDNWGFTSSVYVYGSSVTVTPPLVGIDTVTLSYASVQKGSTATPALTINPSNYDAYQSIEYEVTSGTDYASVNSDMGVVTGKAAGTATIQVTIVDAIGAEKTASADVTVTPIGIDSIVLSYGSVAVGGTASPDLTIKPGNYDAYQSISYSIYSGSSYASVNSSTGVVTGKTAGNATVQVSVVDATGETVTGYCVVTVGTPSASTRYVWNKYSVNSTTATTTTYPTGSTGILYDYEGTGIKNSSSLSREGLNQNFYSICKTSNNAFQLSGHTGGYQFIDELGAWLFGTSFIGSEDEASRIYSTFGGEYFQETMSASVVYASADENSCVIEINTAYSPMQYTVEEGTLLEIRPGSTSQGSTSYGYVSSNSSSTYPSDSSSGSYWYVYQGSDKIDPTAVSYSTAAPTAGSSITATVAARSNTYGGVKYTYQYSTDGGLNWTTSGTTTATSKDITIPSGASSFMVRVLAKDNYGFTSSQYVYGANLAIY